MSSNNINDILKKHGFLILTPLEKLEKELAMVGRELSIIHLVNKFLKINPDLILEHPIYGEITDKHPMLSKIHTKMLLKKEVSLKNEMKKLRINTKREEMKKLRINTKREEMKGKLYVVQDNTESNVLMLF